MKTSDFDYALPPDRIAAEPARPRDAARLLHVTRPLADRVVRDLPELLQPGDLLVFNDTRVIPARLTGRRGDVTVSVTLHLRADDDTWHVFAKPGKRLRPGDTVVFSDSLSATVLEKRPEGDIVLRFSDRGSALMAALERHGEMPLPPYIPRPEGATDRDRADYQTLFAARDGAVAAPTAGLHFTPTLMDRLAAHGVETAAITLHVGAGTFLPVKTEDVAAHRMHAEWGEIPEATVAAIARTRARGGRVLSIGTTVLRLLESAAKDDGTVRPFLGTTDLFITPGFRFRVADLLMTNFHLPRSTLLMLVSAFAGMQPIREAYAHAVAAGYRFYSYGDATLLHRADTCADTRADFGTGSGAAPGVDGTAQTDPIPGAPA